MAATWWVLYRKCPAIWDTPVIKVAHIFWKYRKLPVILDTNNYNLAMDKLNRMLPAAPVLEEQELEWPLHG